MKKLVLLCCSILIIFCLSSCMNSNEEVTKKNTADTSSISEQNDVLDSFGEVIISPKYDPNTKYVEDSKNPNYGYRDGLDYYDVLSGYSLGEADDSFETDAEGRKVYGKLHIPDKYVFDDGDAGLCFDYTAFAKDYLKSYGKATRRSGDFIITDFENGVCINEYIYDKSKVKDKKLEVNIPDKIEGKKVLKLGGACKKLWGNEISYGYEFFETGFLLNVPSEIDVTVKIPKTVRDICYSSFDNSHLSDDWDSYYSSNPETDKKAQKYEEAFVSKIIVDKDNPYYSSKDGILCTKNGKIKLCIPNNHHSKKNNK